MNNKLITEVNRIKEIMLLKEHGGITAKGVRYGREYIRSGIQKMGGERFLDEFDTIFRSNPQTKNKLSNLKDDISKFGDDAVKNMTDEEIELLLRAKDPDAFAGFVIRATKIGESIDTLFTKVDNLIASGKKVDVDSLVTDLKGQLDEIEGLDDIPGLKDNMYNQIDDMAESASRGKYNLEHGITKSLDVNALLTLVVKDEKSRKMLTRLPNFESRMKNFIRSSRGKTEKEIEEQLQKSIDDVLAKSDVLAEKIASREKYADDPKVLANLKRLRDWYKGKYGYSVKRDKGYNKAQSVLYGPGGAFLNAALVDIVLGNFSNWLMGEYDDPQSEYYLGVVPWFVSTVLSVGGTLVSQTKRELTYISVEDAEKWAEENLSNQLKDSKNEYIFTKEDENQNYVDMINFSEDENRDSDYVIMKMTNTIHASPVENDDKESVINKFLEKIGLD
jgi:hypothetical protein